MVLFYFVLSGVFANAQINVDSVYKEDIDFSTKQSGLKQWIIPSVMIAYGFLTVHLDALTDLNENFKNAIWVQHPHSTVTIDNYLQFVPALAVYGLNVAGIQGKNDFLDRSMIYALSNVIMGITVYSLKNITHEERPNGTDYQSFPSGHTAEACASAEFLMQEYKAVSIWYGIGGYAVATSVAYLRMYNNEHWLNDVVAGAGFGIISTQLAYILYPKIKRLFSQTALHNSAFMPTYQNNSFGFSFVHIF